MTVEHSSSLFQFEEPFDTAEDGLTRPPAVLNWLPTEEDKSVGCLPQMKAGKLGADGTAWKGPLVPDDRTSELARSYS